MWDVAWKSEESYELGFGKIRGAGIWERGRGRGRGQNCYLSLRVWKPRAIREGLTTQRRGSVETLKSEV